MSATEGAIGARPAATPPAIGDWLWEINQCRGSLDCWTAYANRKVSPGEHWKGHLHRLRITRRTPKRVYCEDHRRERFTSRADLETAGQSSYGRERHEPELHAAEPPMPDWWAKPAMAAAHPDRGGDPAVFREAHARYEAARRSELSR
ncbi:hypothetical protein [Frankia sp. AgB32]|uniref:hypothetical protein n=1 Tax=Frankia sp. AgB32 TaxID=631119 RepID=UPI00200FBD15|nr:hypothetical protein [Frankia sp. AgB32]MCK9897666.1 hypothetical protein [Frankia sp. AgB32]